MWPILEVISVFEVIISYFMVQVPKFTCVLLKWPLNSYSLSKQPNFNILTRTIIIILLFFHYFKTLSAYSENSIIKNPQKCFLFLLSSNHIKKISQLHFFPLLSWKENEREQKKKFQFRSHSLKWILLGWSMS